jgi:hypothetical protein
MPEPPRPPRQRKSDALGQLQQHDVDVWVATADESGAPYLVPLSLAWLDERIVLAAEPSSRTARNLHARRRARLGLGPTRDVVMFDVELDGIATAADVDGAIADHYAAQVGWDPRSETAPYVYITLRPDRIQAWREANELAGRTLMKNGDWVV